MGYESRRLIRHRFEFSQADAFANIDTNGVAHLFYLEPDEILYDVWASITEDPTGGERLYVWVLDGDGNPSVVVSFTDSSEDASLYPDLLVDSATLGGLRPYKYLAGESRHSVAASFYTSEDGVGRAIINVVVATPY